MYSSDDSDDEFSTARTIVIKNDPVKDDIESDLKRIDECFRKIEAIREFDFTRNYSLFAVEFDNLLFLQERLNAMVPLTPEMKRWLKEIEQSIKDYESLLTPNEINSLIDSIEKKRTKCAKIRLPKKLKQCKDKNGNCKFGKKDIEDLEWNLRFQEAECMDQLKLKKPRRKAERCKLLLSFMITAILTILGLLINDQGWWIVFIVILLFYYYIIFVKLPRDERAGKI